MAWVQLELLDGLVQPGEEEVHVLFHQARPLAAEQIVWAVPTEPVLEELRTLTTRLRRVRRRRYAVISDALAAGHTQRAVAASAGMSPAVLSRMIRQDTARPQGGRLLPGLRTGKVDGRTLRWFVASLPFDGSGDPRP